MFTSGRIRQVCSRKIPMSGWTVSCSPSRCESTDAFAPGGCAPCETCASWFGSPSNTRLRAAVPTASASASANLSAFIDEQRVDVLVELLAREQERRAGKELELRVEHLTVLRRVVDEVAPALEPGAGILAALLHPRKR